ncbi:hypothetical protein MD588_11825 [Photobacterium sp. SDRW27]|uniref:hypothetical protein n=1 Tax=Photobacterium obscurum TaxID=2829490 RepID=UPI002244859E|nr:hypothetical protein [Photobacterium obscurum]MCW8329493.1 hypothetical protein [Photobacterium obscurum]
MLLILLVSSLKPAMAVEVSDLEVKQIAASTQVQNRVRALTTLYDKSDFRALEFNLSQLSLLQQEAVRLQLVQHAVDSGELDQAKADWLQAQAERKPSFTVVEQGDGYQVTKAAFHYGAQARGLVIEWQHILLAQEMVAQAESGSLVLSTWLTGDLRTQTTRRDIFLQQLPALSDQAVEQLITQFTSDSKLMWLPDNGIIAHLAAASGDAQMYHLLWRRRTDQYSLAELNRLAAQAPAPDAVEQLMAATINPSLKPQAYKALITLKPLPVNARAFLAEKLDEVEDGQLVASELAQQGYIDWLEQLASASRSQVLQNNFKAAQAQLP